MGKKRKMSDDHGIGGEVSKLIEKMRSTDQEGGVEVFEMLDMRRNDEEEAEVEKAYEEDGPASVTSSIISLTNTILGAGMLGMARAIQSSGLCLGVLIIALVSIISGYSVVLLNSCATKLPAGVTPSYFKLAEAAFPTKRNGQAWGSKITAFVMAMTTFSGTTSFIIIVADAVTPLVSHFASVPIEHVHRPLIQLASMVVVLPLSLLENLDSLAFVSMLSVGALFFMSGLVVHAGYLAATGPGGFRGCNDHLHANYTTNLTKFESMLLLAGDAADYTALKECTPLPLFKLDLSAVDTVSVATLAYTCQMNVFTVRRELHNPTPQRWTAVWASSNFAALLVYLTVGSAGYIAFGEGVAGNVVVNLDPADKLVIVGRAMLAFSFIVSIPMMVHPCVKNIMLAGVKGSRRTVVVMTLSTAMAVATAVSDVGLLFRWFGGPNSVLMAYILPPLFYFKLAPAKNRKHRVAGTVVFAVGLFYLSIKVIIPIVSTIGLLLSGIKADTGVHSPVLPRPANITLVE